jgi:hypothetical protein
MRRERMNQEQMGHDDFAVGFLRGVPQDNIKNNIHFPQTLSKMPRPNANIELPVQSPSTAPDR